MKDIIINQPHLQSFQQRCSSLFLSAMSWLLWLYFLLPLFTLGGWLLGVKNLSDEIRWFGGYKTLLELLELYGEIIVVITILWLVWSICRSILHTGVRPKSLTQVSDQQLSASFKLTESSLNRAKADKKLTVHFDENALITSIDCDVHYHKAEG